MQQVAKSIETYQMLSDGDYVLIGISGGPDSVALLFLLRQYIGTRPIKLHLVHINHQLREAAAAESAYIEQLAAELALPCSSFVMPVAEYAAREGYSLEQAGHILRFACFRQVAEQYGATKLALGHHQGDRAETVLIHLLQGCGLDGLAALPPKEGWLIRPLIEVRKEALIAYCNQKNLRYFIDCSNETPDCLRNRIRLELLPQLKAQFNQNIVSSLTQLAELAWTDQEYLERQTEQLWQQHGTITNGQAVLPLDVLFHQPLALKRRLLRKAYQALAGNMQNLCFAHVEKMLELLSSQQGEKKLSLPQKITYIKAYDKIYFVSETVASDEKYSYNWALKEPFYLKERNWLLTAEWPQQPNSVNDMWQVTMDADCLPHTLTIRNRRPGDVVRPMNMGGKKKLKEYLIDHKIPASQRDQLPLVLAADEIIWIPGCFLSDRVKVTNATARYCNLRCQKK